MLRSLKRRRSPTPKRVYAVGDVHGRLDLLVAMIDAIKADVLARPPAVTTLIVLGDMIDRGPESAGIIRLLMKLRGEARLIVLKGNHEAAMIDALAGDFDALDLWLAHGGLATLRSYGVDVAALDLDDSARVLQTARDAVPAEVRAWMAKLPHFVHFDPFYFVHAGVQPGVALDRQTARSQLWITEEFTGSTAAHGAVIVHGHTIDETGVVIRPNRIGVDTGAYRTGRLSAVGLQEDEIWVFTAADEPDPRAWAGQ